MSWTDIARAEHNRDRLRFPSDLTDREWAVVAPLAQPAKPGKAAVWRLKPGMNTSPLPPLVMRTKFIWDQNRKAVMGPEEQVEEARP